MRSRVTAPLKPCIIACISLGEKQKKTELTTGEWQLCGKCFKDLKFYNEIVKYLLSGVTVSDSEQYSAVYLNE